MPQVAELRRRLSDVGAPPDAPSGSPFWNSPRRRPPARTPVGIQGVSSPLRPGEIFGMAGVDGNGQRELADVIAGQRALGRRDPSSAARLAGSGPARQRWGFATSLTTDLARASFPR